ncbi:hypothetical protein GCM10023336_60830 [Streptomyces similanensis]|uniref:Uncharacterized protein n=1 Tax=Streptomyces similanensis TaxID=1274988 RepID=A0ABP9LC91_9ACTN
MGAEAAGTPGEMSGAEAAGGERDAEADTAEEADTYTVLRNVRGGARRHGNGARAKRGKEDASSAGGATHAARIADEVHMDPPPQAHIGVGHVREYTMTPRNGQPTVTMRTGR